MTGDRVFDKVEMATYVLDDSANQFRWDRTKTQIEMREEAMMREYLDSGLFNTGKSDADINYIGDPEVLTSRGLLTGLSRYNYHEDRATMRKTDFSRTYPKALAEMIEEEALRLAMEYDEDNPVVVLTPKTDNDNKYIPDIFRGQEVIADHFSAVEGSNIGAECRKMYVLGSPRIGSADVMKLVWDSEELYTGLDLNRKLLNGHLNGYENPYADSIFLSEVHKNIVEKILRSRLNIRDDVEVIRLGIPPKWTQNQTIAQKSEGDRFDLLIDIADNIPTEMVKNILEKQDFKGKWDVVEEVDGLHRANDGNINISKEAKLKDWMQFHRDSDFASISDIADHLDVSKRTAQRGVKKCDWIEKADGRGMYRLCCD